MLDTLTTSLPISTILNSERLLFKPFNSNSKPDPPLTKSSTLSVILEKLSSTNNKLVMLNMLKHLDNVTLMSLNSLLVSQVPKPTKSNSKDSSTWMAQLLLLELLNNKPNKVN